MKTSLIESLTRESDYFYDQKKNTWGCGKMKSITIDFEYNRNVVLRFDKYPELIPIIEQLLEYVRESESVKQHQIKQQILKALEDVK